MSCPAVSRPIFSSCPAVSRLIYRIVQQLVGLYNSAFTLSSSQQPYMWRCPADTRPANASSRCHHHPSSSSLPCNSSSTSLQFFFFFFFFFFFSVLVLSCSSSSSSSQFFLLLFFPFLKFFFFFFFFPLGCFFFFRGSGWSMDGSVRAPWKRPLEKRGEGYDLSYRSCFVGAWWS